MAAAVIAPAPDASLEAYEVSSAVNRTANDSPRSARAAARAGDRWRRRLQPPSGRKKEKQKDDGQASLF